MMDFRCLRSSSYCLALSHLGRRGTGVQQQRVGPKLGHSLSLRAGGAMHPHMNLCDLCSLMERGRRIKTLHWAKGFRMCLYFHSHVNCAR